MASTTTKLAIGDTFYTFDNTHGYVTRRIVSGINISQFSGITYTHNNNIFEEVDALTQAEIVAETTDWLAAKAIEISKSIGV